MFLRGRVGGVERLLGVVILALGLIECLMKVVGPSQLGGLASLGLEELSLQSISIVKRSKSKNIPGT